MGNEQHNDHVSVWWLLQAFISAIRYGGDGRAVRHSLRTFMRLSKRGREQLR